MIPDRMYSSPAKLAVRQGSSSCTNTTCPPYANITCPLCTNTPQPTCSPSKGATAGIAIATAVVGALLAAIFTYLYMRRKNRPSRGSRTSNEAGMISFRKNGENGPKRHGTSSNSKLGMSIRTREEHTISANDVDLDKILPQPVDDGRLAQEVSAFFTVIDGHAENFYHDKPMSEVAQMTERTNEQSALPRGLSLQKDIDIDQLLFNPKSRVHAIACLICAEMLDSIDPFGDTERSLLPAVVTPFLRRVPPDVDSHGE